MLDVNADRAVCDHGRDPRPFVGHRPVEIAVGHRHAFIALPPTVRRRAAQFSAFPQRGTRILALPLEALQAPGAFPVGDTHQHRSKNHGVPVGQMPRSV
jgi:hypothetical protein